MEEETFYIYRVRFTGILALLTGTAILILIVLNMRAHAQHAASGRDLTPLLAVAIPAIVLGACLVRYPNRLFALLINVPVAAFALALIAGSIKALSAPAILANIVIAVLLLVPSFWMMRAWRYL
jgi:hypothetical protein